MEMIADIVFQLLLYIWHGFAFVLSIILTIGVLIGIGIYKLFQYIFSSGHDVSLFYTFAIFGFISLVVAFLSENFFRNLMLLILIQFPTIIFIYHLVSMSTSKHFG